MVFGESIVVILISAAVFLALIFYLAIDDENREKWTGFAFTVALLGGIFIYGFINSSLLGMSPTAVFRTILDIGKMFGGTNRADEFSALISRNPVLIFLFWTVHFFGYYALVSVLVNTLGRGEVKRLRTWLLRIRDIELIYGIDDNAISFGERIADREKASVVFVGNDGSHEATIRQMGGVLYTDDKATSASEKFVKRLHIRKHTGFIRLSAFSEDTDANLAYARKFLESMEKRGISPSQSQLVMLGRGDEDGASLLAMNGKYGFGSVKVFDRPELVARLLIQEYPICDSVSFDEEGKATDSTECLLVGFGRVGQECLRKIVANGQFEGSEFHLTVFDPEIENIDGFFKLRYGRMLDNYNIEFKTLDGRSEGAMKYVMDNARALNYVVIAVDEEKTGYEIAHSYQEIMRQAGVKIPIYQCLKDKIYAYQAGQERRTSTIYDTDILYYGKMDKLAVQINHYYCGENESARKQWEQCDYFSRMSCRASADYLNSLMERLAIGKRAIEGNLLENLAKSEHHRWCAFHYSMGYERMSDETIKERGEMFQKDNTVRVMKDTKNKLHGCLVPWDELDALAEKESRITGKKPDYKEMDRDNVRIVHDILFAMPTETK